MLNKIIKPYIKITNVYSWLKNADKTTHLVLSKKLKFTKPTTITPDSFKKKLFFTATKSFFNQKTGRFKTGLLPIIESHLKDLEYNYDYLDEREVLPELYENWNQIIEKDNNGEKDGDNGELKPKIIDSDFFIEYGIKLHDYQVEAVNFALSNHRGIIKCATGGGKTLILASIIKALGPGLKIIIIVSKRTLVTQIYNTLKELGITNVGRNSSDFRESGDIIISTVKSADKLPDFCNEAKVLIVDEVHEFTGSYSNKILDLFENAYCRFGFSATPFKNEDHVHNHILTSIFGTLLCDVNTKTLTKINILSNAILHFYPINGPTIKFPKGSSNSFLKAEKYLMCDHEYFNQSILKLVESIPNGRIMILVKRLSHGDQLAQLIPNSYWVQGNDDQETREYVIKKLRESKPNEKVVAIFSSIGNVGLDVKIHHLINACGGKDANMTIQKLGRGLRKADDKTHLDYHDFNFSYSVHKALNDHSQSRINTLKTEGHKVILEKELIPFNTINFNNLKKKNLNIENEIEENHEIQLNN